MEEAFNIDSPSGRLYRTPDGDFPSITTILSATNYKKKAILEGWRNAIGHENAQKITDDAAARGSALHNYAETLLKGNDENLAKQSLPSFISQDDLSISRITKWILQNVGQRISIEQAMWSTNLRVAGRVDLIAEYLPKRKPAIIDWKTAREARHENEIGDYFLQTAGYAAMYMEGTGKPINQLVVVIASPFTLQVFEKEAMEYLKPLLKRINLYYKDEKHHD